MFTNILSHFKILILVSLAPIGVAASLQGPRVTDSSHRTCIRELCIPLFTKQCCSKRPYIYVIRGKLLKEVTSRLKEPEGRLQRPVSHLTDWPSSPSAAGQNDCSLSLQNTTCLSNVPHRLRK